MDVWGQPNYGFLFVVIFASMLVTISSRRVHALARPHEGLLFGIRLEICIAAALLWPLRVLLSAQSAQLSLVHPNSLFLLKLASRSSGSLSGGQYGAKARSSFILPLSDFLSARTSASGPLRLFMQRFHFWLIV